MKFAVIGLGQFGYRVAIELTNTYHADVIAIDFDPKIIESIKDHVTQAVELDCTNEWDLRANGVQDVDAAVLGIGEAQDVSILTAALLRKLGVAKIIARAKNDLHGRILKMIGVNEVVFPEDEIGKQIARNLAHPQIREQLRLTTNHLLVELPVPQEFIGKSLLELNLRANYNVNVIAIQGKRKLVTEQGDNEEELYINDVPKAENVIREGDVLVIIGDEKSINQISQQNSPY